MTDSAAEPTVEPAVNPTVEPAVEPAELERLAVEAGQAAAQFVRERRGSLSVDSKSNVTDLVTDVDRAAEALLVSRIRDARPHDAIVGEEGGAREGDGELTWVLDPIDGTVNFVLGLPQYSVSVAVQAAGVTLAGCVVDVAAGVTYHAHRGGGAWSDRERLPGPRPVPLDQAVVCTGFSYDAGTRAQQGAVVAALLPRIANLRRLGSAALDLCHLAAGRLHGYYEAGLNEWDRAAGVLIAREAGAVVSGLHADEPDTLTIAAAGELLPDLVIALREAGA